MFCCFFQGVELKSLRNQHWILHTNTSVCSSAHASFKYFDEILKSKHLSIETQNNKIIYNLY